eukprot:CAMPEP_0113489042 /NCGR_PEP_ID=MMETSP0014_2-20120614/26327_1 /TAXON_ID=2857 /ORGANISM="Nitzschia sp." /LENGTH=93 /DNA_ID=CAMNT_0000382771 /DNA_START=80 /DNA_END=361 /DNA_ORIENTATION=+ /assembly_acc=CAM_ASM_000159
MQQEQQRQPQNDGNEGQDHTPKRPISGAVRAVTGKASAVVDKVGKGATDTVLGLQVEVMYGLDPNQQGPLDDRVKRHRERLVEDKKEKAKLDD